jgi:hypothetical protein
MKKHLFGPAMLLLLLILGLGFVCTWYVRNETDDVALSFAESEYRFDPTTIQQSILSNASDPFHLVWKHDDALGAVKPTEGFDAQKPQVVSWTEDEFLKIAYAFYRQANPSAVDIAELTGLHIYSHCESVVQGPYRVTSRFYYQTTLPGEKGVQRYFRDTLTIDSRTGYLNWKHSIYSEIRTKDVLLGRHIPTEIALQIADSTEGQKFRDRLNDSCTVSGSTFERRWRIRYDSLDTTHTLIIDIDVDNGSTQIIRTPTDGS